MVKQTQVSRRLYDLARANRLAYRRAKEKRVLTETIHRAIRGDPTRLEQRMRNAEFTTERREQVRRVVQDTQHRIEVETQEMSGDLNNKTPERRLDTYLMLVDPFYSALLPETLTDQISRYGSTIVKSTAAVSIGFVTAELFSAFFHIISNIFDHLQIGSFVSIIFGAVAGIISLIKMNIMHRWRQLRNFVARGLVMEAETKIRELLIEEDAQTQALEHAIEDLPKSK